MADQNIELAKAYSLLDDLSSSSACEKCLLQSIDTYNRELGRLSLKSLSAQEEYIKFLLKQERYNVNIKKIKLQRLNNLNYK